MTNYDKLMEQMTLRKLAELLVTPVQYEKMDETRDDSDEMCRRTDIVHAFKSLLGNTYDSCDQAAIENVAYLKMEEAAVNA